MCFIVMPLHAEVWASARAGVFANSDHDLVSGVGVDVSGRTWSFSPAFEVVRGGHGVTAAHVNVRRLFRSDNRMFWVGAGPTFVHSDSSSDTTFNVDAGLEWRANSAWAPFVAARYYSYSMPVFRDVVENNGVVISVGISRRIRE
ncbi:MAG TPA: hypothetical protein VEK79_16955 [Thermoanaerobaculia bacterium]|nr:hypothetical protein [Thermoanaerobaculia bacterium]